METKILKTDLFKVPFTMMDVVEGKNKREDYGDIEEIVQSIREDLSVGGYGIKVPMEGYFKKGRLQITRGHRRYEAMRLIYERHGVDVVARVTTEPKGYSEENRLVDQWVTNSGKDFTPLEKFYIVKDLIDQYGYNGAQVAKRVGVTEAYISRLLLLGKAPDALIELIRNGTIKATLAMDIIKQKRVDEILEKVSKGEKIPADTYEEENTDNDGKRIKPASAPKERITNSDISEINSWKEFKKAAIYIDVKKIEGEDKRNQFKLLTKIANNELTYDQFVRYFKLAKD